MNRRLFLKSMAAGVYAFAHLPLAQAALPKMKITRIRAYAPGDPNPLFNQADTVVTVETDAGVTGVGEGGFPDVLKQCAGRLIGQDPQHIERLWQDMSRSFFYPPGREKEHALGALDLALWDIKGKALKLPVHEILGGMVRNYCECYNTGGMIPGLRPGMSVKDRAAATVAAGYRAFRMGAADTPANTTFNTRQKVHELYDQCAQARGGIRRRPSSSPKVSKGSDRSGRGMGESMGFQPPCGEPRYRLCARYAAERGRHYRDDEDRGDLRDAFRGHCASLYRTHRHRSAGEFVGYVLGSAADGVWI